MKNFFLVPGVLGAIGYVIYDLQSDERWFTRMMISVLGFGIYAILTEIEKLKERL